ncbi:MAG TPA: biotin transporter BioY [Microbacteriaceae bacterium]|nr:biotin transporter BioY [Microbacteriaceae bacterium]
MTQPSSSVSAAPLAARNLAHIVVFAALIAALTVFGSFQIGPVPLTLQTFGVLLAGALLGPRKGPLAVALYLFVGAVGVPVFANGSAGLGALFGPTGGFLFGFVLAAWVVGALTARLMPNYRLLPALGVTLLGGISVYLVGAPWLAAAYGPAVIPTLAIFIPGDLLKVVATVLVATSVHRALPGLFGTRGA